MQKYGYFLTLARQRLLRTPFTIQLIGVSKTYVQGITLGVDAGSRHVGLSATTTKQELFSAELRPRNDVVDLLSSRREMRRSRRNRTTRYRKVRFDNRVHSKHKGWLTPSVEVKIHNHIQGISLVAKILPITTIRVETAEFDLQRLKGNGTRQTTSCWHGLSTWRDVQRVQCSPVRPPP